MNQNNELRVYLHDLATGKQISFTVGEWMDQYTGRIRDALALQAQTLGGTFSLTGTAERGRITVYAPDTREIIRDIAWNAMTAVEACEPPNTAGRA
ncbi:hypothetical protein [Mycolicibacterium aubagnense]|uniref:Uncharacterized protein n=1 Tax=Mycolicibacterium aubagnense TaxID=319707 RepID=A0ABM7IMK3_9MYCO|nr:hypothetical protein [Mycolicibacterium aubagnense]TLH64243.1 hypothetical protein C1S80_12580 [Mycolicibacterium aubagnense]BBX87882.1 hypothetical protein MAUB_57550 [Mycolicibacterium aubagnense]